MTDANHEKRIKKIEAEMVELRKQIMQVEFISKRDSSAAKRTQEAAQREHEAARKEHEKVSAQIDRQIKHVSTIMGITYDELNMLDEKIQESGRALARPRKRSIIS